jgi:hypothetical protein
MNGPAHLWLVIDPAGCILGVFRDHETAAYHRDAVDLHASIEEYVAV